MKSILFYIFALGSLVINAQTFVSVIPENKNIILEDFTGISCGNCPDGHQIAQQIKDSNPNDVFLINIHTGSYANPQGPGTDFNTISGTLIAGQAGIGGYPAGTVNRHQFTMSQAGGIAMSRWDWDTTSTQILAQLSPVNIGIQALIDMSTNTLTVDVEVYYTGTQNVTSNMLNIAIVQHNIEGPQSGMGQLNGIYNHNHMLRHMLTGNWGDQITNINPNTLYSNQYTWLMPDSIQDVPFDPINISVIAFVSEGNKEILSGTEVTPDIVFEHDWDVDCVSSNAKNAICGTETDIEVTFRNFGNQNLLTVDFNYSINGGANITYPWSGNLSPNATEIITITGTSFIPQASNIVSISSANPNGNIDQNLTNDYTSANFTQYNFSGQILPDFIGGNVTINVTTDKFGEETSWELISDSGTVLASVASMTLADTTTYPPVSVFLNSDECYSFIIYDFFGDGMCCMFGDGSYSITDASGDTISSGGEGLWTEQATHFKTNGFSTAIKDIDINKKLIKVIDLLGRETKRTKNEVLFYIYNDGTVEKRIVIE